MKTKAKTTKARSNGNIMYDAIKKELDGSLGARVRELIRASSANDPHIHDFSSDDIEYIIAECLKGRRAESVAADLLSRSSVADKSSVEGFSRSVMSRYSTALTQARAEDLGCKWFIWRTSKDARVRPSHRLMDRVICAWSELPNPEVLSGETNQFGNYAAGNCPDCRCYCEVLLSLDQVQWPAHVHAGGKMQSMTRAQFEKIEAIQVGNSKSWHKKWQWILRYLFGGS